VSTSSNTPDEPTGEPDLLAHISGSLSDALEAIDRARAAVGTSLVWTHIAQQRRNNREADE
jgi:hypothetical protein